MTPSEVGERAKAALMPLRTCQLRIAAPRSGQAQGIRWAEQFRLDWAPPALETDVVVEDAGSA